MAAEHWFRWHHGTVSDPKWRTIASRASRSMSRNVTIGHVIAVWAAMLECASQANPRGSLTGWDDEDVAAGLGMELEEVAAIREAMDGKTVRGNELTAWNIRQPKREDGDAAARKRAQRDRERSSGTARDIGESHEASRNVTTETETETEEKKSKSKNKAPASPSTLPEPPEWVPAEAWAGFVDNRRKIRHPLTARAAQLVIAELTKLRAAGHDPGAVLDQSTRNGWRDVFALREQGNGRGRAAPPGDIFAGAQ